MKRGVGLHKRMIYFLLLVFSFGLANIADAAPTALTDVRWAIKNNSTDGSKSVRLVIDAKAPVKVSHKYNAKGEPNIVIDIRGVLAKKDVGTLPVKSDNIKKIVVKRGAADTSQIIIYLNGEISQDDFKVFTLRKDTANKMPDRVVIDVFDVKPQNYNTSGGLKGKTIVIDPGHGGSDPGAVGLNKTFEKTMTLSMSLKLRDALAQKGARVVMTRTTDVDVHSHNATAKQELQARVDVAERAKADIFVSVHHNASTNRALGGIATYYTPNTQYDTMLAKAIQNRMAGASGLQNNGIKTAEFYVTKRSSMPAVLLEIAFISNPKEEALLNSNWFQNKIVASIVQGIEDYFSHTGRSAGK